MKAKTTKPVLHVVPASRAKNNFGEIIKRVYEKDEIQIIERAGLPVVGIVSMSDIERLYPEKVKDLPQVATSAKRHQAAKHLRAVLAEMHKGGEKFSEEEVMADALKAIEEVRRSKTKS